MEKKTFNRQEVFDTILDHLRAQKVQSLGEKVDHRVPGCRYRGQNGTMCAVGCLIPDEIYTSNIEGDNVLGTEVQACLKEVYSDIDLDVHGVDTDYDFLEDLQYAHDRYLGEGIRDWEQRMAILAHHYKLDYRRPV